MRYTPTALQLAALKLIDSSSNGLTKEEASKKVDRRALTGLFKKSLVEWGGPVHFGNIFVSRRGQRFLK